jgi:SAM-dependent methyltransferase
VSWVPLISRKKFCWKTAGAVSGRIVSGSDDSFRDDAMGTAREQGQLWGARAREWAEANESAWLPVYRAVFERVGIRTGLRLLDVGCGAGGALALARELGAEVAGLDASANLLEIARERLPGAPIEIGDMEELPFPDEMFDAVIGMNSFQFAGDIVQALREARRVCRRGGTVAMLAWGRKDDCDLIRIVLPAIFELLPPAPAAAAPPLAEPGVKGLVREAGLLPGPGVELAVPLAFPDHVTAVRAVMSAMTRVIRHAGEEVVRQRAAEGLARLTSADGTVVLNSRFRLQTATRV